MKMLISMLVGMVMSLMMTVSFSQKELGSTYACKPLIAAGCALNNFDPDQIIRVMCTAPSNIVKSLPFFDKEGIKENFSFVSEPTSRITQIEGGEQLVAEFALKAKNKNANGLFSFIPQIKDNKLDQFDKNTVDCKITIE